MKKIVPVIMMVALFCGTAFSEVILEVDFSGTPNGVLTSIAANNFQLTVHPLVMNRAIAVVGGTAGTQPWRYSATGNSLGNAALYGGSTWGAPSRFDLGLDLAAAGKMYTLSDIEVDIVQTNATDIRFSLWFATDEAGFVRVQSPIGVIPAGTTGTYSIALGSLNLTASDSTSSWNLGTGSGEGDLRLEFYGIGEFGDTFEIDAIRINGTAGDYVAPVVSTVKEWEFNTLGDTEGWEQGDSSNIVAFSVVNTVSGPETVLASQGISGADPQLVKAGIISPSSNYWSVAKIRARQLDTGGNPLPWDSLGCAMVIDNTLFPNIGNESWDVVTESGEWIVATLSISRFETNDIFGVRVDPVGESAGTNKNFEVDYIWLGTNPLPAPANVSILEQSWEFNTPSDTEGWTATLDISGLTVTNAVSGSESVLTCADVTGNDPNLFIGDLAWVPTVGETWDTVKIRLRLLDANGGSSRPWIFSGSLFFPDWNIYGEIHDGNPDMTVVEDGNDWVIATIDISARAAASFNSIRLDPVGNDEVKNFEVDYIRVYSSAPAGDYNAWIYYTGLVGTDAEPESDPDGDLFGNFSEFSFGGHALDPLNTGLLPDSPRMINVGGTNALEYVYYRRSGNNHGLDYSLISVSDLIYGTWAPADHTVTGVGTFSTTMDSITNLIPVNIATKFINVKSENQ